ncbi:hypothetical protein [Asticcacaulis sp.]|uniref:hypothetical protein n=1 Tax=Asticcacaulis sp. TaxID=1872648 RepID=UPI002C736834|nr:hypothetical protein [Asticcacaulis sp.]HTM80107.1 hypothetical protein [Asticcacaulis sp.]
MSLIAYPIAADAHEALTRLKAGEGLRAVREKEAELAAKARVAFVTQTVGPVYESRNEALDAYAGLVEDDRKGRTFMPAESDRFCVLTCRIRDPKRGKSKPMQPVFAEGQRWPQKREPVASVWQLSLSYWKIMTVAQAKAAGIPPIGQARHLRKKATGRDLTPEEIAALSQGPLMAARPQKALDFGLFDFPLPENPAIIIADE